MCLGVPGQIQSIQEDPTNQDFSNRSALVRFGGIEKQINLTLLPEAQTGDYVIVHAGFAISKINEQEALKTLQYFKQLSEN